MTFSSEKKKKLSSVLSHTQQNIVAGSGTGVRDLKVVTLPVI